MLNCKRNRISLRTPFYLVAVAAATALLLASPIGCSRKPILAPTPPTKVVVAKIVEQKTEDWDDYTGLVAARDVVDVRAQVQGYIKKVYFKEGDEVKADDKLFQIDDRLFKAQRDQADGQINMWKAKLAFAEDMIKILAPLVKKESAAKTELDKAKAEKSEAKGGIMVAQAQKAQANLNVEYAHITAPISGRVSEAHIKEGNLVSAAGDQPLTTITPMNPMYVYFYINESIVQKYQDMAKKWAKEKKNQGNKSQIAVSMGLATEDDYPHKGVIDYIDQKVNKNTGAMKVRARFDNRKDTIQGWRLLPGSFAKIRVSVTGEYKAFFVAERAILTDLNTKYILVVNKAKKNLVERINVATGRLTNDGLRLVRGNLKGDEWVIVEAVTRVRPGVDCDPVATEMPRIPREF